MAQINRLVELVKIEERLEAKADSITFDLSRKSGMRAIVSALASAIMVEMYDQGIIDLPLVAVIEAEKHVARFNADCVQRGAATLEMIGVA